MGDVLYFQNLKDAGGKATATGTLVGTSRCLDVSVKSSVAAPVFVSVVPTAVKESRVHDAATTNINGSAGAWVAFGGGTALANTITSLQISGNIDQPFQIGTGANAGAVTSRVYVNAGGEPNLGVDSTIFIAGQFLWIRSLTTTGVTGGIITMNLLG